MTARPSTVAPITATLFVLLMPLVALYVGGYYWLGEINGEVYLGAGYVKSDGTMIHTHEVSGITRVFPHMWQATIYRPAALIESLMRRIEVKVVELNTWQIARQDGST